MRTFTAYRPFVPTDTHDENQRNQPNEPQFQGVEFDDGTVAIRWLTAKRSVSVWASLFDALDIHGHAEYGTYFIFDNDEIVDYIGDGKFRPRLPQPPKSEEVR